MSAKTTSTESTRTGGKEGKSEPTQAKTPEDKLNPDNRKDKLDERLDEGLEETFPSSDPVSVKVTK